MVVDQFRLTGTVSADLPYGISNYLNASNETYSYQLDAYNPKTLAESLPAGLHALVTCSNGDTVVLCSEVDHVAQGLAVIHADTTFVRLVSVSHALLVATRTNYGTSLPFSPQVQLAIKHFVKTSL